MRIDRLKRVAMLVAATALLLGNFFVVTVSAGNFTVASWKTGLPSSAIISVKQSRDGYLWLGTSDGLARFDGTRFTTFDETELPGLSTGPVSFLFGDSRNNLWCGTDLAGSFVIKEGQARPLDIGTKSREGRLVGAAEAANGDVWLITANGHLCRYREGKMNVWGTDFRNVRGLALEANGTLWVSSAQRNFRENLIEGGLFTLDSTAAQVDKPLPNPLQRSRIPPDYILASRNGGLWLFALQHVQKVRGSQVIERDLGLYPWGAAPILSACEDREGNLIVGVQDGGVTWFDRDGRAETLTASSEPVHLSHATALSLCLDREGDLWVGTDGGGLNRVKRNPFSPPLASREWVAQSVCGDDAGGLWTGYNGWKASYWNNGAVKDFGAEQGLFGTGKDGEPNFSTVFVDSHHRVWVGTRDVGLFQLVSNRFQLADPNLLAAKNITAIFEDRAGSLWVGTDSGLAQLNGEKWNWFATTNGLSDNAIFALADDAAGNLWIGTGDGLDVRRDANISPVTDGEAVTGKNISALLSDSHGVLWVGTRGRGLAAFANGKWQRLLLAERADFAINSIKYIAEDDEGALWIGSAVGLVRIQRDVLDAFLSGKIASPHTRIYGEADGLPTSECSSGSQPATWRATDGTMWFTTTRGLISVNPSQLARNTNPPPVMIESVLLNDVLQNTNRLRPNWPGEITIPAGRERLEIRYTSLNLSAPDRARFKYKLDGLEQGWTDAGSDRSARYPKLPPGNYTFRVLACNEDGVWSEDGATLSIIVQPPFWQTWWFIAAATILLLGIVIATVHLISTQKLQRQLALMRQQEALERERARIARDLHDQLGANLTQISLLGEMVETDKNEPAEVESHAQQISTTARSTAAALDEIVWAANPSNDTLESLVTYACKYAQEYFALAGLTYRIEAPPKLPATPIFPDVRHNVFLAFKESVNNVVKHAQATTAKVRVLHNAHSFTLEIEDNGRGLPPNATEKGRNGLRNMRRRMEDVGGEFAVAPAPERGTLVRLTAPLNRNSATRTGN